MQGASDAEVYDLVNSSDIFLSIGIEGYGIPVLEAIRLGVPVLFDGVQPAGELMQGAGALRVTTSTRPDMQQMFTRFGTAAAREELAAALAPDSVPTWAQFARQVAFAARY